ncbi:capsid scaffolding protein [Shigella boydii]|nr:capsid scaffolding protein [Shigella boydii]
MANEKKTSRKKFRVAVSGSTVDGREISPVHLREAAENFNPDVYAARVNVEHYLSPCPSSEFSAMGDVTALRVRKRLRKVRWPDVLRCMQKSNRPSA